MICIPVVASGIGEMRTQINSMADADLIELRLDYVTDKYRVAEILKFTDKPVIVTCRPTREGGNYSGSEKERLAILQEAVDLGAAYVDIEHDSIHKIRRTSDTKRIASIHNFEHTPDDLDHLFSTLAASDCDIVKVATMATRLSDNVRMLKATQESAKPAIGICMGELGEASRILGLAYGSVLTFGVAPDGKKSAPGQIAADELSQMYRVKQISLKTKIYAVVGEPIAHSMSPAIHNAAFRERGIDAVYLKFRASDFPLFLEEVADPLNIAGLSVTIPHKHAALEASDQVQSLAGDIGAVNTLTRTDHGWRGDNTDCAAALDAIRDSARRAGFELAGKPALLLGAGGTARAIGFGLRDAGCELTIANRTKSRAEVLAQELDACVIDLCRAHEGNFKVVANTTSVGMTPDLEATPVDSSVFHPGMVAFDAVYNPLETRMLRDAASAGAETANGLKMFIGQASRQFETWTCRAAPRKVMEEVVLERMMTR